jgi:hypothetical protein
VCLNFDQTKAYKTGSTLPVKLRLCDANGTNLSLPSVSLTATSIIQLAAEEVAVVEDAGHANPDGQFRYVSDFGGSYIFNLSLKDLAAGTYALMFTADGDSAAHSVKFHVR